MTPALVRDELLRRALAVRATSRASWVWLSDASLVALGWQEDGGFGPGTMAEVDALERQAHDVDPAELARALRLLRLVAR